MTNARDKWHPRVQQWLASGLTADQFAAQHGFKPATLRYWKSILSRSDSQISTPQPPGSQPALSSQSHSELPLVELRTSVQLPGDCFELELATGARLRIPSSFEPGSLRRLLSVLEPRP